MTNSISVEKIFSEYLTELITNAVKSEINSLKDALKTHTPDELLTREQAIEFLKIDSSTLWHWTNKGKVKAYGIGNRRYYKKAELLESLIQVK
jgi:predicted oxidoreductase